MSSVLKLPADGSGVHISGNVILATCTADEETVIVSGGADGEVKLVALKPKATESSEMQHVEKRALEEDIPTITTIEDNEISALGLGFEGEAVAVGLQDGTLDLYQKNGVMLSKILRFAGVPVRQVDFFGADFIVAASEEPGIRIVSTSSADKFMCFARGSSDVGVKNFALDPKEEYIACIDMDGKLKIYSVDIEGAREAGSLPDELDIELVKTEVVTGRDDGVDTNVSQKAGLAWHPDGSILAVPGRTTVALKFRPGNRDGPWKEELLVSAGDTTHMANVSLLSWSTDGSFLASADTEQTTIVWDMSTQEPLALITTDATATALKWAGTTLIIADCDGNITSWDARILRPSAVHNSEETDISSSSTPIEEDKEAEKANTDTMAAQSYDDEIEVTGRHGKKLRSDGPSPEPNALESDEEELNFDSEEEAAKIQTKKDSPAKKKVKIIDDEAMEDDGDANDDADQAEEGGELGVQYSAEEVADALQDDINDDEEDEEDEDEDEIALGDDPETLENTEKAFNSAGISLPPSQRAFMPSSTPMEDDGRRILCWNAVGCITSREEGMSNAVEIDFADTVAHRAVKFTDRNNLSLGALSDDAAIFANIPDDDDDSERAELEKEGASELVLQKLKTDKLNKRKPSVIFCNVFNAATSVAGTWNRKLAQGERAEALAIGSGWVAVFTDQQLARIYGTSGIETDVFRVPGPILSAAGSGRRLFLVYRNGASAFGPSLGFQLLDVPDRKEISCGVLPVVEPSPGTGVKVEWVGFAEPHGMPCFMDSTGVLSGLTTSFGGTWAPILDSKLASRNTNDHFWPIAVTGGKLNAITLKGSANTYPSVFPRPLPTSTLLAVPPSTGADLAFEPHESSALTLSVLRRAAPPMESAAALSSADYDDDIAEQQTLALDKVLLKLMKVACDSEKYEAALDAAKQLTLEGSFKIALLIASHCNLPSLYPRIQALWEEKKDEENRLRMAMGTSGAESEEEIESKEEDNERAVSWKKPTAHVSGGSSLMGRGTTMVSPWSDEKQEHKRPSDVEEFDDEKDTETLEEEDEDAAYAEVDEVAPSSPGSPPAKRPVNPFSKGGSSVIASPPRKRKNVFDLLKGMQASPSPNKRLSRNSSIATAARDRVKRERHVI